MIQAKARQDLFAISALFLFMELAFIRWFPAQVLFLTFFTNTVLLASFLGLSLGCLAARRERNYLTFTPALLLIAMTAAMLMEWARRALQTIVEVGHSSPQMVYFGAEAPVTDVSKFVVPIELVAGAFFVLIAAAMIGPGQVLGRRFAELPNPIDAYTVNVGGSLAGVLVFNLVSWWLPPVWWFAIIAAGLIYFLTENARRNWFAIAAVAVAPVLIMLPQWLSLGPLRATFPVEIWSPYYRINYRPVSRSIAANLIGQQTMISRADPYPAYSIPYLLNRDSGLPRFHDILIIGAGSGNDVSRALAWATEDAHIDAVEIDPVIQSLGKRDHPDQPYQDPRVTVHLGDGRNFLRSTDRKYDLIVFALIDSLVLHSSVSNIRLESYLFTREAMQDVQRRLKPDGLFAMYNYFRQGWIVSRLTETLDNVFGRPPLVLSMPLVDRIRADQKSDGFSVFFEGSRTEAIERAFREHGTYGIKEGAVPGPSYGNGFEIDPKEKQTRFAPTAVEIPPGLRMAEDVWPFLYLRNPMIPDVSWRGMVVIGVLSLAMLWMFAAGGGSFGGIEAAMLLLGAGFMLLETKAVVHMALIFGSTWIVNTVVFSVLLVMVLAANLWVLKRQPSQLAPYYIALLALLAVNIAIPLDSFLGLSPALRGTLAGALVLSPVFCAGVIFATLIKRATRPERALAYNTAGAILGGLAENLSLLIGFQWILAVAGLIYLGSWVFARRRAA